MNGNGARIAFGIFLAIFLIAALGWVLVHMPAPPAPEVAPDQGPVAVLPEIAPEMTEFDEALPPELGVGEIYVPDPLTAQLSIHQRPKPKPPSLLPLTYVERIVVEKAARKLTVIVDGQVARVWRVALGKSPVGDKSREGDNRTPEGVFRVDRLKEDSAYTLALGLDYPQPHHRAAAQKAGVRPGGDIMIHGQPNLSPLPVLPGDWTAGCVALANDEIEELFGATVIGTEVEIRP